MLIDSYYTLLHNIPAWLISPRIRHFPFDVASDLFEMPCQIRFLIYMTSIKDAVKEIIKDVIGGNSRGHNEGHDDGLIRGNSLGHLRGRSSDYSGVFLSSFLLLHLRNSPVVWFQRLFVDVWLET